MHVHDILYLHYLSIPSKTVMCVVFQDILGNIIVVGGNKSIASWCIFSH